MNALSTIVNNMDLHKYERLINALDISQLNYCLVILVLHIKHINGIHVRALRQVYQDNSLLFAELLENDNSMTIHRQNVQVHAA